MDPTGKFMMGFNSKMVRLKGNTEGGILGAKPGFNSKMVRLKVFSVPFTKIVSPMFQFQNGAIKRLKSNVERITSFVSIPKWCD